MNLASARAGVYRIVSVGGEGKQRRRLLDMGFTPDCTIRAFSSGGGMVLVALRGFSVALRNDAAECIRVEKR